MAHEDAHRKSRIVAVFAATLIALACGTNYAYSAWGPQFAERMQLSATENNLIGAAGNIGMYAAGIPLGLLIDSKGPRWGVMLGAVALACGYFPLYSAYNSGPGTVNFALLCFFSFLTGMGSCSAFSGAIKVSATNWPRHRGTATAFPLSAFGLSALAFTIISGFAFPNNTGNYLLLLSLGTFVMVFTGMFFLRMIPPSSSYQPLSADERNPRQRKNSSQLHRARSHSSKHIRGSSHADLPQEAGQSFHAVYFPRECFQPRLTDPTEAVFTETSSLLSAPGHVSDHDTDHSHHSLHSHHADITGWALLRSSVFWRQFIMLSLLCGVGLMTINNIGNDAKALWHHYDDTVSHDFIQQRQLLHVSILSLMSFTGRLLSGIGSDIVVKKLHSSRYWSVVASALIFTVAQILGLTIENPNMLFWLSGLTGLAYGALFGVYPALVADTFGAAGLGINWGAMTMAPVISANIFNVAYGRILDANSTYVDGGERRCIEGRACYHSAYILTLVSSVLGVVWSLWCVRHEWVEKRAERKFTEDHEG